MQILGGVYQRIKSSLLHLPLLLSQHHGAFFAQGVSRGGYFDMGKVPDYLIYCVVERRGTGGPFFAIHKCSCHTKRVVVVRFDDTHRCVPFTI
jgi:hypothetical protein